MPEIRFWTDTYKGNHIALLWNRGHYSAFINREILPAWKINDVGKGQELLRQRVDTNAQAEIMLGGR